jgi:hypothetical protein
MIIEIALWIKTCCRQISRLNPDALKALKKSRLELD